MDWYVNAEDPQAVQALRHEIRDYLSRHASDPETVWGAELAIEELLSNALRHTPGAAWVSIDWSALEPVVTVHDLGKEFAMAASLPDDLAEGGRGLFIASHLTKELDRAAKRSGGNRVSARLRLQRAAEASYDPPRRGADSLPAMSEQLPDGGFGRESFLRALVVELAQAIELSHGPAAAHAAVAQVGTDVGGQMEAEYRLAKEVVGRLTPDQMAACYVRLKHAIEGGFYVIEATAKRIVLGNTRCPFGEVVQRAPALCRMTSSVFGGIAARNAEGATVVLEERIAVGDPECRVVVFLDEVPAEAASVGHRYAAPPED